MSHRHILTAPRSPGRAAIQARFGPLLGKRFVLENAALLGQGAAAVGALKRAASSIRGRGVNVFTQWVGDPDALGSALLLRAIMEGLGAAEVRILTGSLGHPQNRAMVRKCGIEIGDPNRDRLSGGLNCMVDASPPLGMASTTQVEPERDYLFVVDHHTEREEVEAHCRAAGVRRVRIGLVGLDVGSTSAFLAALAAAFRRLDSVGPEGRAAAALGIYTDTSGLLHGATPLDFRMFERLTRDPSTERMLHDLRDFRLPPEWHGQASPAYLEVEQVGQVRFAPVGRVPEENRDVIAEIADELLRVDRVALAFAVATTQSGLELSIRADSRLLDGDGERVARVVHDLLESVFQGVSGYKRQRLPPHRVEGGAHLPLGDPRESLVTAPAGDPEHAAMNLCRAWGRHLLEALRGLERRTPGELRGLL